VADVHTTYNPAHVARFLDDKFPTMERLIRERLRQRGFDPDELIQRNLAKYQREQDRIDAHRAERGMALPASA
jgi:hypothetical protein